MPRKPNPLVQWLADNDLSVVGFSRQTGIAEGTMRKLIAGHNSLVSLTTLWKIHEVTGISVQELVDCALAGKRKRAA